MKTIIIHADLDNILFENRNKAYGAYEIRKNYNRRLEISFLITAITTLTLCLFFYMKKGPQKAIIVPPDSSIVVPPPVFTSNLPPVEPKTSDGPKGTNQGGIKGGPVVPTEPSLPVDPDKNAKDTATAPLNDSLKNKETGFGKATGTGKPGDDTKTGGGDTNGCVGCSTQADPPKPFQPYEVQQIPDPINLDNVQKRIFYPVRMQEAGIPGKVTLRFLVNANGDVETIEVRKATNADFENAVMKEVPRLKFKPAMFNNKAVRCYVDQTFQFNPKK